MLLRSLARASRLPVALRALLRPALAILAGVVLGLALELAIQAFGTVAVPDALTGLPAWYAVGKAVLFQLAAVLPALLAGALAGRHAGRLGALTAIACALAVDVAFLGRCQALYPNRSTGGAWRQARAYWAPSAAGPGPAWRVACMSAAVPPTPDGPAMALLFLLQLIVILLAARLCGLVLKCFGQPPVIGEMAAGLLLGPVVFGAVLPDLHAQLFAPASLPALGSLSTLGLVLFMFVVGVELRAPDGIRAQLRSAGAVGVLSVLLPMGLGLAIAPALHPTLAPAGVPFWPFALFMAAAMAITAFPVMARILKERGLTRTPIGQLSLSSAAIADVFAWILLALVMTLLAAQDGWEGFARAVIGLVVLVAVVMGVLRPLFARLLARHAHDGQPSGAVLGAMLIAMLACAAAAEWLHLHAVFGAFVFGACLPRDDRLLNAMLERVEHLAVAVLMPVFFALAGLNTTPDAFSAASLGALALVLVAAIGGKLVGGAAGARLGGQPWRASLAVGSLMNARGMMELIIIKIGLDAGLIGPELFTMLLVMALVTTVMTSPLLTLFAGGAQAPGAVGADVAKG